MADNYSKYLAPLPVRQRRVAREDYVYEVLLVNPDTTETEKLTVKGFEELFKMKPGSFRKKYSLEKGGDHVQTKSSSLQSNLKVGYQVAYHLPDRRIALVTRTS